ncbi:acyl-CoA dehydrogenase family protein [Pseudonocardia xinjiangensis]|uniref:acyl-CoA dehydrogenase family protein n=1 Tax=Pseudonocardia xinjiangensis TaxID=75289 RepID=UPI003D8EAB6B
MGSRQVTSERTQVSSAFTTKRHDQLREKVRAFAESVVEPRVAGMEASRSVEVELAREIARQGWIGVTIGPRYGGMGLGHLAKTIIIEELSRVSGALGAMAQASMLGVAKILHFGTEEQKRRWLPGVAAGHYLPTIAVTEQSSGGHVLGMTSSARREGDEYVLNGRKVFVGNSHIGHLHGVVARTGPGSRGLSAFLVEADRPGFYLSDYRPTMGLNGFSFGELIFENCRIPAANRLGAEGEGLSVAYSSSVLYGRLNLAAVSLGIHQALLEETLQFVANRWHGEVALSNEPTVRQKLGAMQASLMTARVLAYHASHLLDEGVPCDAYLMNAKLQNVELSLDSARTAMEVHAAHGLSADRRLERLVRDAYHIYAPAGTSDVQRLRLAEVALQTTSHRSEWSELLASELRASSAALRAA